MSDARSVRPCAARGQGQPGQPASMLASVARSSLSTSAGSSGRPSRARRTKVSSGRSSRGLLWAWRLARDAASAQHRAAVAVDGPDAAEDERLADRGDGASGVDFAVFKTSDKPSWVSSPPASWRSCSASLEAAVKRSPHQVTSDMTRPCARTAVACSAATPAPFAPPTSPTDTPRWSSSTSRRR